MIDSGASTIAQADSKPSRLSPSRDFVVRLDRAYLLDASLAVSTHSFRQSSRHRASLQRFSAQMQRDTSVASLFLVERDRLDKYPSSAYEYAACTSSMQRLPFSLLLFISVAPTLGATNELGKLTRLRAYDNAQKRRAKQRAVRESPVCSGKSAIR